MADAHSFTPTDGWCKKYTHTSHSAVMYMYYQQIKQLYNKRGMEVKSQFP
jgi:hypothetical protein